MIDASFAFAPAREIIAIDLWDDDPPALPGRAIRVEPRRWWLLDKAGIEDARAAIAERGAVAPIGGGLVRATISGACWRDLLSVSGFLDTETLRAGDVVRSVIHHVPVTILVTEDARCEIFFATSYADTLKELWERTTRRGAKP